MILKNIPRVYYHYMDSDMVRAKSKSSFMESILKGDLVLSVEATIVSLLESTNRKNIADLLVFMKDQKFYQVPASLKYHQNWIGGLAEHSLAVTCNLIKLQQAGLLDSTRESIIITGILHDLCKIDNYTMLLDGGFDRNPNQSPGHASKSIQYIKGFIELTEEEEQAIRFHMGAYNRKDIEERWTSMANSYRRYPLSYWLHVADMMDTYNF